MLHLPPGLRWTWLICLVVLALTPLCDPLLSPCSHSASRWYVCCI